MSTELNIKQSILKSTDLKTLKRGDFNFNKDLLLFCILKGDLNSIESFLNYYRGLGVEHFFIIYKGCSDKLIDSLKSPEDVSIYGSLSGCNDIESEIDWLNYLLRKYGIGKWCITCNANDFLVYPFCELLSLKDLTTRLDSLGLDLLLTPITTMHLKDKVTEQIDSSLSEAYSSPLDGNHYFGKTSQENLDTSCLVKWSYDYFYVNPPYVLKAKPLINRAYFENTGCMLRLPTTVGINHPDPYSQKTSVKYQSSKQLIDLGLMNHKS